LFNDESLNIPQKVRKKAEMNSRIVGFEMFGIAGNGRRK